METEWLMVGCKGRKDRPAGKLLRRVIPMKEIKANRFFETKPHVEMSCKISWSSWSFPIALLVNI